MSSTYVLTLPLKTELWQEHIINKRFNIARQIYNACLGEILKRNRAMRHDQRFQQAVRQPKSKARTQLFRTLAKEYGVSEYDLIKYATPLNRYYKKNIPAIVGQVIASRAWKTFDRHRFDTKSKKVKFKRHGDVNSIESKNDSGIIFRNDVVKMKGLEIPVMLDPDDEYQVTALQDRVKYARILKKIIKGKERFFVQLMLEGLPPKKRNHRAGDPETTVGIDIGTQVIGIVTDEKTRLRELAPDADLKHIARELRILNRKRDRQRRANNPNKFNADGTVKRGNRDPWVTSKNEQKTRNQIRELYRLQAVKRKLAHQKMANDIIALGLDIRAEDIDFAGLAKREKGITLNTKGTPKSNKRFGKSIGNKAPSMLIDLIDQKLNYKGLNIKELDTPTMKITQFHHDTGEYIPQAIHERWDFVGHDKVQRNLYNAFLIKHTTDDLSRVDVDACNRDYLDFKALHDKEINRLKAQPVKHPSGFGF